MGTCCYGFCRDFSPRTVDTSRLMSGDRLANHWISVKLIFVTKRPGAALSLDTDDTKQRCLLVGGLLSLVALGAVMVAMLAGVGQWRSENTLLAEWQRDVAQQAATAAKARENAAHELTALTVKTAELHARLLRLDALGERVAVAAKLDHGEFDFSQRPAVGGPAVQALGAGSGTDGVDGQSLSQALEELHQLVENRERQLALLDQALLVRNTKNDAFIAGRPIKKGWLSSRFGQRTDPFNGKKAWHEGVDFAGSAGADVVSVAGGVVTFAGKRSGYGHLVEINHSDGYRTRYAHNDKNLVAVGDTVGRGQVIALMGSSGRSTGPHVHFEVSRWGKPVDPVHYINRRQR